MRELFGRRLKKLRRKAGFSQKELASILNVTASTVSNYESGIYLPPLQTAYEIAINLHASLDYMTGLTGEEKYIKEPEVYIVAEEE